MLFHFESGCVKQIHIHNLMLKATSKFYTKKQLALREPYLVLTHLFQCKIMFAIKDAGIY